MRGPCFSVAFVDVSIVSWTRATVSVNDKGLPAQSNKTVLVVELVLLGFIPLSSQ